MVTTVLFLFPPELPVTGSNMSMSPAPIFNFNFHNTNTYTDYCVVAFFLVFVIAVVQWYVDGKQNFTGPRIDMDAMQHGEVVGIVVGDETSGSPSADFGDVKEVK